MDTGDTAWVLASSALVLLMTPGLAFFYGGLVRDKNVLGTIMHSFFTIPLVSVVWVLWGYSLAFGPDLGGFIGNLEWFGLRNVSAEEAGPYSKTIPHQAYMVFQLMFAIITPALISGAFAERMKFSAFVLFIVLWSTIVYSPLAHWVWGQGGWLAELGAKDYAGGTVVHISAGFGALAAALVFGRRAGYGAEPMQPHNIPFVVLGAALLWFGWFGFNAGSALAAGADATSAFVATNTAAAMAAVTWVGLSWAFTGKASVVGAATGAVAGLATITPASGFVGPMPALLIGFVASVICYAAIWFRNRMKLDDSLDVWGVHGVGAIWGVLATGLFMGIGFKEISDFVGDTSRGEQVLNQLVAIGASMGWGFVMTLAILLGLKHTIGLRLRPEDEESGLDLSQHGEEAYRS